MKRVMITGASGLIGGILRDRLADRYELIGLARRSEEFPHVIGDINDINTLLPAFEGTDAVVHMAGVPHVGAPWADVLTTNINGTYNVYEAARQQGVGAVIFASTNHTVSWWEAEAGPALYGLDHPAVFSPDIPMRADSYYGVSKAAGETLGRYYSDAHGLRVFCLRIGWVLHDDDPANANVGGEVAPPLTADEVRLRLRAIYLSHRDCAELVRCCLDADHVRYGVYYGVSNNPRLFYDLSNARQELGYEPRDSAPR
ncbi:MAG: NAD-dependent epimerase/dehydratase family protein [Vicinamibacterales bacterium]